MSARHGSPIKACHCHICRKVKAHGNKGWMVRAGWRRLRRATHIALHTGQYEKVYNTISIGYFA